MRLKSIKLVGFKSFVDPTTVDFPTNLSAVVGPNGCGKSNIIDAVRWVMGESSAKNLRGEAMTDVIFNGSNARKPVGQASIELVFDNSEGKIIGEYGSFAEISIKRKVTRDGQNLYYLNGTKCRRRDITDIFLGTGLGPRSYAIIEQGMISRLIEAKPEELRVYIEEAAGISKYKERRRDTENRMRRTQENLERLTDIREELERQISRLERQAQSAEKFKEFKEVERDLKAKLQGLRYKLLNDKAQLKQGTITELELQVEAGVTEQVHHDSAIEIHRTEQTELSDKFNEIQGRFYSVGGDIARIEQTIQHIQEREKQLGLDLEQVKRDCAEAEEHLAADMAKAEGWEAELLEIEPELSLLSETEESSNERLQRFEESMQNWQQTWDEFNQKASEPRQQAEVQQSRIQYLEQVQTRLNERIRKIDDERQGLVLGDVEEEITLLEEQLAELELTVEQQRETGEQANEEVSRLRESEGELNQKLDQAKSRYQQASGRKSSLEALQQAALVQTEKSVTAWLATQNLSDKDRLAERLKVAPGWEAAVETVLGDTLQAVVLDSDFAQHTSSLGGLEQGNLTLIQANGDKTLQTNANSLLSKVLEPIDLSAFLGNVLVADSLEAALALRSSLNDGQSVITQEGLWLSQHWIRVAKGKDAAGGVIERKQQLEQLEAELNELEAQIESLTSQKSDLRAALLAAEQQRDAMRKETEQSLRKHSELKSDLSKKTAKVAQVLDRKRRADTEISEAQEQLQMEAENLSESRAVLQEAIDAMEQDTDERESLLAKRDNIRNELEGARQKARHDKDQAHTLAMRSQSINVQLSSVKQGIQRLREQTQRLLDRREKLEESLLGSAEPIEDYKMELEVKLTERVEVDEQLQAARRALEEAESKLRNAEKMRTQVEQSLQTIRANLERERLETQSLKVQADGLKGQLEEEELVLEAVLESLDDDLEEGVLVDELQQVENRISRLGAINLAAIDEFKTESERKNYLDSQNEDLQEALETLENAILKIDKETRTRFKETFDQINAGIQELFPKVFGGGHAYLELTGEDLLDTGIAIMARPPGKKNSTIHLLSGGEKALTAIALVFSIFRLNPAPFCMLDEVDAPLDDANVGRYARMVEEMSAHVQFIYITHNKIAMEMAMQLMGVTMHEPGVSRIVTVDVDAAAELAAS